MAIFKNVNNMKTLENYELKFNPFRTTPASNPEEIIWAGFNDVRQKMENRIKRAIRIPNSSLVLNWGEYGSGKTHAARFFQKTEVLDNLSSGFSVPFPIMLNFPQGKDPVKELYVQIIDKLDIEGLRGKYKSRDFAEILKNCTDNILIRNILNLLFDDTVSATQMKAYLYGNVSIKSDFIKENVQRKLESDNDYTEFLAALFSFLSYEKEEFSCIILWIDEFENIATLNIANVTKMNNCIRTLLDKAPNNLLIFMNLTQSAMMDVDDLSAYLQEAVRSRIKEKIELPIPGKAEVKGYLEDLLNNPVCRIGKPQGFMPFTEEVVNNVIKDLGESVSLRKYNEIFSALLEYAMSDDKDMIDNDYYQSIKNEIVG